MYQLSVASLWHESTPQLIADAIADLRQWAEMRDYCGFEPYDLLNAPALSWVWKRSTIASAALIQLGKRYGGIRLRRLLHVPQSKNPKGLGLFLAGYCDLLRRGCNCAPQITYLKSELKRLSALAEVDFSWGYDWNFVSARGSVMPAFAPNAVATVFCANALLDAADLTKERDCELMAHSAAHFLVTRLNRSAETPDELCFSYTPQNHTQIFNSSALVAAFLARVGMKSGNAAYVDLARRAMVFLCRRQRDDGAWTYGVTRTQQWVDGFHTAYNLCALRSYARRTGDASFNKSIERGYEFYKATCFTSQGIPKYFDDRVHPIDIHACSQAILTFSEFSDDDPVALPLARKVAEWTLHNMRSEEEGCFFYQRHRLWTNRTPYMRWAQAWMFRALARLSLKGTDDEFVD